MNLQLGCFIVGTYLLLELVFMSRMATTNTHSHLKSKLTTTAFIHDYLFCFHLHQIRINNRKTEQISFQLISIT